MTVPALPKSPNRRRVLVHVQANPGMCLQEIADQTGMTRTALAHHLRALTRSGLVQGVRQGRRMLMFPSSIKRATERSVVGLMRQASARAVLEALYRQPTESYRKVAQQLGLTPHSVRWHVARLEQMGLIHVLSHGLGGKSHTVHFHPTVRESLGDPSQLVVRELRPAAVPVPARAEPAAPPQGPLPREMDLTLQNA